MVFAGVYKENGVYPRLYADFQKTRCLVRKSRTYVTMVCFRMDGSSRRTRANCATATYFNLYRKTCVSSVNLRNCRKSRSCVNEEVFFIQAKIDIPHCANHIFQELHSKGLVGRVFFATRKHDDVESPRKFSLLFLMWFQQSFSNSIESQRARNAGSFLWWWSKKRAWNIQVYDYSAHNFSAQTRDVFAR